tara:strand:- start:6340 stop:6672 length:333 start_codon:yes stop_codon:yes gene_type:complete
MTHNITPEQQLSHNLDMQASMWANKIMTRKLSNQQCKYEIAQQVDDVDDMQTRVRKYLNAGLVTNETYAPKIDNSLARLREAAKSKAIEHKLQVGGSKDGLWSTDVRGKK